MRKLFLVAIAAWVCLAGCSFSFAIPASDSNNNASVPTQVATSASADAPQPIPATATQQLQTPKAVQPRIFETGKIGLGVKVSLLGVGVQAAVPVMTHANLRVGLNMLNYSRTLDQDGVSYVGKLNFRSSEAYFDWFPFHGSFHLSPGVVYNGNKVTANASVPPNQTFSFNDISYASSPSDPLTGNARLDFKRIAPAFVLGWGNLVPRGRRHWSIPVELGVIYQDAPRLALNFSGSACDASGVNCQTVASDPSFQSNLQAEQAKLNHDIAPFKFYPVISIGFGYKF